MPVSKLSRPFHQNNYKKIVRGELAEPPVLVFDKLTASGWLLRFELKFA
jgi:hypothetical protein